MDFRAFYKYAGGMRIARIIGNIHRQCPASSWGLVLTIDIQVARSIVVIRNMSAASAVYDNPGLVGIACGVGNIGRLAPGAATGSGGIINL
jgi:hypothetical protein